jgi:hypothetical protein
MPKHLNVEICLSQLGLVVTGVQGFGLPRSMLDKTTLVCHLVTNNGWMRDPAVFHPLPIFRCLLAADAYFLRKKHDMVMNGDYVSFYKK